MYNNYRGYPQHMNQNGDRFGFAAPFLLGGLAGAAIARPNYYPYQYPYPYYSYPYYGYPRYY